MTLHEKFSDTDMCVKCGLCLPHCPTYNKTLDENESPRGRLALIQGWADNRLAADDKMLKHLDNCLLCRACERACPALVPYGRLMDDFRSETGTDRGSMPVSALKKVVRTPARTGIARSVLQRYQRSTARAWIRKLELAKLLGLGPMEALVPEGLQSPGQWREVYPAEGETKGRVALFVGCMGRLVDGTTVDAAIRVLTRFGFEVRVPPAQGCCGALHLHSGDRPSACDLAANNLAAFEADSIDAIVTVASGCGALLREYPLHVDGAEAFADKIEDIGHFLANAPWPDAISLAPLEAKVSLHTPCSLRNVMGQESGAKQLLECIPGLRLLPLADISRCCGSAGSYMLEHPAMAKSLRADILEQVAAQRSRYVVSSNIGCILYLAAGLRERGAAVEVLHPMVLLDRQMSG